MSRWTSTCVLAAVLLWPLTGMAAPAAHKSTPTAKTSALSAKPRAAAPRAIKLEVHRVYTGQTLGMIAKRYNVSIEALCYANGITRKDPIRPGQKLYVPTRKDTDGSAARRLVLGEPEPSASEPSKRPADKSVLADTAGDKVATLKAPAGSKPESALKVTPARAALPEKTAAKEASSTGTKRKSTNWQQYRRPAPKKGYVTLNATGRTWKGYATVKGNRLASAAQGGFNRALYSWRTGKEGQISPQLIRLLTQVSDTFGGRPLKVASGYREHSHAKDSRHKLGHACDFTVVGVPNEALRDYLLTLSNVGVGYYANSSFVHLDVRRTKTYWIDYSGPGQAPRYSYRRRKGHSPVPATAPAGLSNAPSQAPANPSPSAPLSIPLASHTRPAEGDFIAASAAPTVADPGLADPLSADVVTSDESAAARPTRLPSATPATPTARSPVTTSSQNQAALGGTPTPRGSSDKQVSGAPDSAPPGSR